MTFLRRLAKTELAALAALVAVAILLAGFSAVQAWLAPSAVLGIAGSAAIVFGYILIIGSIPAFAFGAPVYALLWHRGKVSWVTALAIGLLPGLALLFVAKDLGLWSLACGATVALATHAACGAGSNNSFKPNLLRSTKHMAG